MMEGRALETPAESAACRVYVAIGCYFDRRIANGIGRADSAESAKIEELSLALASRYQANKESALATHVMECRTCSPDAPPVRCSSYHTTAEFFDRPVAECVERARHTKGRAKALAKIAQGDAERTKERYLQAHLDECEVCT